MQSKTKILVALDLDDAGTDAELVVRARKLGEQHNAELVLLQTLKQTMRASVAMGMMVGCDIEQKLAEQAQRRLSRVGDQLDIPVSRQLLRAGRKRPIALQESKALDASMVVFASSELKQKRLGALFGRIAPTANSQTLIAVAC